VLCGVCGERLPEDLLFNACQKAKVEKDLTNLKNRARQAREAESKAKTTLGGFLSSDVGPIL
jgi:hypothetical protein